MANSDKDRDKLFEDLFETLSVEVALFESLLKMLRKKQKSIVAGDIEVLRECVLEEQSLIQRAKTVAETRQNHVVNISKTIKMLGEKPKLKMIIEFAPSQHSVKLTNLRYQLKVNLDLISKINRENSYLLNSSIECVKGLIHLFLSADEGASTLYNMDGNVNLQEKGNKVLDYQI